MITVAIIEDEPIVRKEITYLVEAEKDVVLVGWADNVKAAAKLLEEKKPDLVLLDIQLRDGTAFDLLKALSSLPENVIFITAYNQFAIRAIKYGALDYLLKPIDQEELSEAMDRFRRRRERDPQWMQQLNLTQLSMNSSNVLPESIALHSLNNVRIITVQDILYCKGDGPYTFFYMKNGSKELVSKPLKYYEELLSAPFFLRTHQSYLVNRQCVSGVSRSEYVVLENKEEIPISLRRKSSILKQLFPSR